MTAKPDGTARRSGFDRFVGGPRGFRQALEKRGPIFIKIGQFLALRPDLISEEYCNELMVLFDDVEPFSWHEARHIIREDLGKEPAELFASVDPRPVAAGSLAQTYLFGLADRTKLAVKVLRPNIREAVDRDVRRARRIARLFELSGKSVVISPRDAVEEIAGWLGEEIDGERELANVTRLYRLTSRSRYQVVPRPYPELSGPRVITTEYLEGLPVSRMLVPGEQSEGDAVESFNRDAFARNLLTACLTQIFVYRFFHADLHPGNLMILAGDRIGFVDFGLCSDLDDTVRNQQMRYLSALYEGDTEQIYKSLLDILLPSDRADYEAFRREFLAEARTWNARVDGSGHRERTRGSPSFRSPAAQYMIGVMRAARTHGFAIPASILALYRTLLTAESVAAQVGSKVDLRIAGRRFFIRLRSNEARRSLDFRNLESTILDYVGLWRESPAQISHILSDINDGRFTLNIKTSEHNEMAKVRNRRTKLIAAAVMSVGLSVVLVAPELAQFRWAAAMLLVGCYVVIARQWRRLL